jgi:hypothetical protein
VKPSGPVLLVSPFQRYLKDISGNIIVYLDGAVFESKIQPIGRFMGHIVVFIADYFFQIT